MRKEMLSGGKQQKGKAQESLQQSVGQMLRRAQDTQHGFQDKVTAFLDKAAVSAAEESSPEKLRDGDDARSVFGDGSVAGSEKNQLKGLAAEDLLGEMESAPKSNGKGGGRRVKDIARLRATAYEKQKKVLSTLGTDAISQIEAADKLVNDNQASKTEYEHFFDIIKVRKDLLQQLAGKDTTQAAYESYVQGLDDKSLALQPLAKAVLLKTQALPGCNDLCQSVLVQTEKGELDNCCKDLTDHVAVHNQVRNALKTSCKDLDSTVKQALRRQKKEKEKADKQKASDEKKNTEDKQALAEKLKADKDKGVYSTLLQAPANLLTELGMSSVATYPDVAAVKTSIIKSEAPFIITSFSEVKAFIDQRPALKCLITNFSHQFPGTAMCSRTGRAQSPVKTAKGDNIAEDLQALLGGVVPLLETSVPEKLQSVTHAALYGFTSDMVYYGFEERGLPQLRYICHGSRQVFMIHVQDFLATISKTDKADLREVLQLWKVMDIFRWKQIEGGLPVLHTCIQKPGSLMYIPPGFLIAEKVLNSEKVVGIRMSLIPRCSKNAAQLDKFRNLLPAEHPYLEMTELAVNSMRES
ncbi:unnamed protein product [Symbiodinium natans]|uniref:Uncharacterized protein n=1 Tax=Symbiodinium natans TaxID=878477 RepID=A0A812PV03_9DINO|nr:unnamed protein product [Symbiodinium natans]